MVNPARAGMIRRRRLRRRLRGGKPRASGDDPMDNIKDKNVTV